MIEEFGRVNQILLSYLSNDLNHSSHIPQTLSQFIQENIDFHTIHTLFNEETIVETLKNAVTNVWTILAESLNMLFSM